MTTKKIIVASEAGLRIDSMKDISNVLNVCLSELIHEHRSHPSIRFFDSEGNAKEWLNGPL